MHDPACRFLQSLPTGPHALLGLIERDMQGQPPRPEETFTTIGDLLGAAIAPPQVSAALYRTAALIPGVTVVPDAIDAIGRQALRPPAPSGASAPSGSSPKKTFRYLGARDANVATGSPAGVSAVPRRASAGHAGQIPG